MRAARENRTPGELLGRQVSDHQTAGRKVRNSSYADKGAMTTLISFFISLIVLCIVLSILYWIITLVSGLLPTTIRQPLTTLLLVLLALMALCSVLDMTGVFGTRHFLPMR